MEDKKVAPQGSGRVAALICLALAAPASKAVSISEILYDASGRDADKTFIELVGTPGESLDGLRLVGINGGNGQEYLVIELSGSLPQDGLYLIADGTEDSSAIHGAHRYTDADLQNGPDSLQLRRGDLVIDAVGYGDFSNAVFGGRGNPAPDVPAGMSLTRIAWTGDNATDYAAAEPTPGTAAPAPVPIPGALWLFGSGLCVLGFRNRILPSHRLTG